VDRKLLRDGLDFWRDRSDVLIVEGIGGLLTPVSDEDYVADLAREFGLPLLVVSRNVLGVINQTLQTLHVATTYRGGLQVAGVVMNDVDAAQAADDPSVRSNPDELRRRCAAPVLAHVGWGQATLALGAEWPTWTLAPPVDG
jgi:dethiobiotin synthetase